MADTLPKLKAIKDPVLFAKLSQLLLPQLSDMITTFHADINKKVAEITFIKNHPEMGLTISDCQHGADATDTKGGHWELKTSTITTAKPKVNFNWHIPETKPNETEAAYTVRLLASIDEKCKDGGARFDVQQQGTSIRLFNLCYPFLRAYFERLPNKLTRCRNMNFGCKRCNDCGGFHRLEMLERFGFIMLANKQLTDTQWVEVFGKTPQRCNKSAKK
jgi:hypothetical protein